MDRGFLFGDGVYEVFPVYNGLILGLESHLKRLQEGLDAINIVNPWAPLAKPFAAVPKTTATIKII